MIKCIIIDDEKLAREILSILILKSEKLVLVEQFSNAIDAMKYLNSNKVDLIFLDIHGLFFLRIFLFGFIILFFFLNI